MTEADRPYHPSSMLFPLLDGPEFDAFQKDIADNGQLEPIWLHPDGSILDGRNRHRACVALGLVPEFRQWQDNGSPITFVVSMNLHRRHLTSSQRAAMAPDIMPELQAEAKRRQGMRTDIVEIIPQCEMGKSRDQAAKVLHTNPRYVSDAMKLADEAPELLERVREGELNMPSARRQLKQRTRAQELEETKQRIELEGSFIPGTLPLNSIKVCAIADLELPPDSIDMIFTDPPYHDEWVGLYGDLGRMAAQALKPGAYLMAYAGKMFLPQILNELGRHLEYVSTFAVFQSFSKARIMKHNIFENWRPIVAFKKAGHTPTKEWIQDVVRGSRDKQFHDWQQDQEAPLQYIPAYTKPGDVVLDPFCGGGTTPHACKSLGRYYLAFDADEDAVKLTIARLNGTDLPQP